MRERVFRQPKIISQNREMVFRQESILRICLDVYVCIRNLDFFHKQYQEFAYDSWVFLLEWPG